MSLFGLGSKKQSTWLDPVDYQRQVDNYAGAQANTPAQYTPTSAGLIGQYMNPYTDEVVNKSLDALERSRQMAVNNTGDAAMAAHAYGGSRHGVAESLTNQNYLDQAGLLSSQLYNQGYSQALQTAQGENQYGYQYPLLRQGVLNNTLEGIQGRQYGKGQDPSAAIKNFGGLLKTGGDIASFFMKPTGV